VPSRADLEACLFLKGKSMENVRVECAEKKNFDRRRRKYVSD